MLLKVARLRHAHKIKESDELLASLSATPPDADAAAKEESLAKQRVRRLRDTAFSFGGLSLTQRIVRRFLAMQEVQLLLPAELRRRQQQSKDDETAKLLLETAKAFLTKLFKARCSPGKKRGGRLSDEDRNARAAALAALLPADLFDNRRGRAAMRILGISYRQAKYGSTLRGEIDLNKCWKWIKTSEHYDKAGGLWRSYYSYNLQLRSWRTI